MSQNGELPDVLRAFKAGADDVLRAPFVYAELRARVRALLGRDLAVPARVIEFGVLRIDTTVREVTFAATPIKLRRQEYELIVHLARDPHRVYTKHELLRDVWGVRSCGATTRTLASHASRLRRALTQAGADGWVSATWGVGYRLAPNGPAIIRPARDRHRTNPARISSGTAGLRLRRSLAPNARCFGKRSSCGR
jgi:DNA-binding response OmpR family regulator